jgi:tetratricopeptide (TPR) repeat protein
MLGRSHRKSLGLLCTVLAGSLVVYLVTSRVSPHPGAKPAGTVAEPAGSKQHEAKILAEALKKKPEHTPVLMRLAQLSEEAGKQADAADRLRAILRQEPNNTDAQLELGRVLFQLGDVAGAIQETKKIVDRQPGHADALYNLGAIYGNLGQSKLAREYWNRLLASSPQSESAKRARTMISQLPPEAGPSVEEFSNSDPLVAAKIAARNYTVPTVQGKK